MSGIHGAPGTSCGGEGDACECGGTCGGSVSTTPGEGNSGTWPTDCSGTCDSGCDNCLERKRVTGLNWGKLQADSGSGMSNFWREATIGHTFRRATGENLPSPLLPVVSGLGPDTMVTRFEGPPELPRLEVGVDFWRPIESLSASFGEGVETGIRSRESLTPGVAWWQPALGARSGMDEGDGGQWADLMASGGQQEASEEGGTHWLQSPSRFPTSPAAIVNSDSAEDPHAGEAGKWVNKMGEPVLAPYGTPTFWLTVDHWEPDPPPEPSVCCCCVKDVYVDSRPDPHARQVFGDVGDIQRVGNAFKVVAELKHSGKGEVCKCKMTWEEYANQRYNPPGGKKRTLAAETWHKFSDPKWDAQYANRDVECSNRKVEFEVDTPGSSLPIQLGVWELWIQVCVSACDNAECKCDPKEKCVHVHQVVTEEGPRTALPVLSADRIRDGTKFKADKVKPPPKEPPGGWR
jgi:hypothetical protein